MALKTDREQVDRTVGPDGQQHDHLVLPDEQRTSDFIRPVRLAYVHTVCGTQTSMPAKIAETYAIDPGFYGSTFCCGCGGYFPVGHDGEFLWDDGSGERVGT